MLGCVLGVWFSAFFWLHSRMVSIVLRISAALDSGMCEDLCDRKSSYFPVIWTVESENDIFGWNPCVDQLLGNFLIGAIPFEPDFLVFDAEVNGDGMDSPSWVPADVHQHVAVLDGITDGDRFDLSIAAGRLGVAVNQGLDDLAVVVELVWI
jgi:hypothetical protein